MRSTIAAGLTSLVLFQCGSGPVGLAQDRDLLHGRVRLHAHNCYPEQGRWADRLQRALDTGARPLAIEQDLVWIPPSGVAPGRSVVAHEAPATGDEPTLEQHFFHAVRPVIERALADNRRETWPVLILHVDFKTNEPQHHDAIWSSLGAHEPCLTTAERRPEGAAPAPFDVGPLLVLTEDGEGQERAFFERQPVGSRLRLFGTVPSGLVSQPQDPEARADALVRTPVEALVPSGATSYRRWTNHSWAVVERGGPLRAADWTRDDAERLQAIVGRAHDLRLWLRFYTLNGHAEHDGAGWSTSYNFGSLESAEVRWRAAAAAGVDLVATDQYEEFVRRDPR